MGFSVCFFRKNTAVIVSLDLTHLNTCRNGRNKQLQFLAAVVHRNVFLCVPLRRRFLPKRPWLFYLMSNREAWLPERILTCSEVFPHTCTLLYRPQAARHLRYHTFWHRCLFRSRTSQRQFQDCSDVLLFKHVSPKASSKLLASVWLQFCRFTDHQGSWLCIMKVWKVCLKFSDDHTVVTLIPSLSSPLYVFFGANVADACIWETIAKKESILSAQETLRG